MAAQENLWKIKTADGGVYTLSRSEITVGVLRQFKGWFGPSYGKFLTFVQLLMEGDADAWCCALWLVQKNNGEKPKQPQFMDFAVGDVMLGDSEDENEDDEGADEESGENPTTSEHGDQTHD